MKEELANETHHLVHRWRMAYIRQHEALGLGHAVLQAKPLVVTNHSRCCWRTTSFWRSPSCLTQLLEVHHKTGETTVALMQVARERSRPAVLRGAIAMRN